MSVAGDDIRRSSKARMRQTSAAIAFATNSILQAERPFVAFAREVRYELKLSPQSTDNSIFLFSDASWPTRDHVIDWRFVSAVQPSFFRRGRRKTVRSVRGVSRQQG
jgi:hypothetical protein